MNSGVPPNVAVPADVEPTADVEVPAAPGRRLTQLAHRAVTEISGIGPARARALESMGIASVLDLIMHYPRRYADRSHPTPIAECAAGDEVVVEAKIVSVRSRYSRSRKSIVEVVVEDASGSMTFTFFNQPYRKDQLRIDDEVVVFGKVDLYRSLPVMTNPTFDRVGDQTGAIIPIYPQSGKAGISSRDLNRYIGEALDRAKVFAEPLSEELRGRLGLVDRTRAFRDMHRPLEISGVRPARRRLAFDELWRLQLALVMRKRAQANSSRGIAHRVQPVAGAPDLVGAFISKLPFDLTSAQVRALDEIAHDLADPLPMHRLLQGDVGSGKTVVALATLLYGVQSGHQGALMVPTEVLAEQHFAAAERLLAGLVVTDESRLTGDRLVNVALLTSETTKVERSAIRKGLLEASIDIVVGTHALLTDDVQFSSLGIVVIDEQHRFGVDQRAALREKGALDVDARRDPDLLVMTATPIPRTAAMTVYGDLDYCELDELPAGRRPVRTRWVDDPADEERVWARVLDEVRQGRQAFVVCPRVRAADVADELDASGLLYEEDDRDEPDQLFAVRTPAPSTRAVRAAVEEFERLANGVLAGIRVGLLHGQMPSQQKDSVMDAFREHRLDVLVATTVIEVGVDIRDATVMVIEDADHFGIAQLHQLRGRVGRGDDASYCYLLGYEVSADAELRLRAMVQTSNGFELAETDLDLRGEGTVLGVRQKGRNGLRVASLRRDRELVGLARSVALGMIEEDPSPGLSPEVLEEVLLFVDEEEAQYLERS